MHFRGYKSNLMLASHLYKRCMCGGEQVGGVGLGWGVVEYLRALGEWRTSSITSSIDLYIQFLPI